MALWSDLFACRNSHCVDPPLLNCKEMPPAKANLFGSCFTRKINRKGTRDHRVSGLCDLKRNQLQFHSFPIAVHQNAAHSRAGAAIPLLTFLSSKCQRGV